MSIAATWHIISAACMGPALLILNRLPNRSRSKRVHILSSLLFWLLLNSLLSATQKLSIITGLFKRHSPQDLMEVNKNNSIGVVFFCWFVQSAIRIVS